MKRFGIISALLLVLLAGNVLAQTATVTVPADLDPASATGIRIEGLVSDKAGNLYTADLDSRRLFRIGADSGQVTVLGTLPAPASGMAFDSKGDLYMASSGNILRISADRLASGTITTTDVTTFAEGAAGSNGLAFDAAGNLYVSGGATGSIYRISPTASVITATSGLTSTRADQRISTNGLAFGPLDGKLYSSNTGDGAIDRFTLNADGTLGPQERVVSNTLLLGADGITFASNGDLYVAANERNAIVRVAANTNAVSDVASNGADGPLEFPASPSFSGNALYASNFDIARGANSPNTGGKGASIARIDVGISGAPLPFPGTAQVQPPVGSPTVAASPAVSATTTVTGPVTLPATPPAAATPNIGATPQVQPPVNATPTADGSMMMASPTAMMMMEPTATIMGDMMMATPTMDMGGAMNPPTGLPNTGKGDNWLATLLIVGLIVASLGFLARYRLKTTR